MSAPCDDYHLRASHDVPIDEVVDAPPDGAPEAVRQQGQPMMATFKPEQTFLFAPSQEHLDAAIEIAPDYLKPIYKALRDDGCDYLIAAQGQQPFFLLREGRPTIVQIGDDLHEALGPNGFHGHPRRHRGPPRAERLDQGYAGARGGDRVGQPVLDDLLYAGNGRG